MTYAYYDPAQYSRYVKDMGVYGVLYGDLDFVYYTRNHERIWYEPVWIDPPDSTILAQPNMMRTAY